MGSTSQLQIINLPRNHTITVPATLVGIHYSYSISIQPQIYYIN